MSRDRLLKQYLRERFVVTLKSGDTFDGLLNQWDANHMEFVDAHVLTNGALASVDGELYLPRSEICYMQRPNA